MRSKRVVLTVGPNNEVVVSEILERINAPPGKKSLLIRLALSKMRREYYQCKTEEDFAKFLDRWGINDLERGRE